MIIQVKGVIITLNFYALNPFYYIFPLPDRYVILVFFVEDCVIGEEKCVLKIIISLKLIIFIKQKS